MVNGTTNSLLLLVACSACIAARTKAFDIQRQTTSSLLRSSSAATSSSSSYVYQGRVLTGEFEVDFGLPYYHNIPWTEQPGITSASLASFSGPIPLTPGVTLTGQSGRVGDTLVYQIEAGYDKTVDCLFGHPKSGYQCQSSATTTSTVSTVTICFSPSTDFHNMMITCQVSGGTMPTMPTGYPTIPPDNDETWFGCFSKDMTVQVKGKGTVAMKDLSVGDHVLVKPTTKQQQQQLDDPTALFQPIYGFGHYHPTLVMDFLQIHINAGSLSYNNQDVKPLEMTGQHLIYVANKKDPIRADDLQVGDKILIDSIHHHDDEQYYDYNNATHNRNHQQQQSLAAATITKIDHVFKQGVYLPLTPSGTIVVNGIFVSSYVSVSEVAPTLIERFSKPISILSEHELFHWWLAPYRVLCMHVVCQQPQDPSSIQQDPPHKNNGILTWLSWGQALVEFVEDQHFIVQALGVLVVLFWVLVWAMVEGVLFAGQNTNSLVYSGAGAFMLLVMAFVTFLHHKKERVQSPKQKSE